MNNVPEVIIVGAGHAGLSISYYLHQENIPHIIFERGTIGNSWRTQRWDNFYLNTPNWMNKLPGGVLQGSPPDGFMHRDEFVEYLNHYAACFRLPVQENTKVISAQKRPYHTLFEIITEKEGVQSYYTCRQLVLACGTMCTPKISPLWSSVPADIYQLHGAAYRNADALPKGAVLVAGGGQSGCQIAEDLALQGRQVYFASSRVGRYPRRYRGKDILEWATENKFFDAPVESITDPHILKMPNPHISGAGRYGHTLSLQLLHQEGVHILGRLIGIYGYELAIANDAVDNVRFADGFSEWFKKMVDDYISKNNIDCEPAIEEPADLPDEDGACTDPDVSLNLKEKGISTIIWTTGYTADFSWIKPSVVNDLGEPVHHHGISPVEGIYFIGFPWLRSRKSGILYGIEEDAAFIADQILQAIKKRQGYL